MVGEEIKNSNDRTKDIFLGVAKECLELFNEQTKASFKEEIEELKLKIEALQEEYESSYVDKLAAIVFLKVLFL